MSDNKIKGESKISMLPVFQISINKCQPRKMFNKQDLRNLARSIELNGILQPLIVRDVTPFEYELISGERRLRAAVMAGFSYVPCLVIHCTQKQSAVYSLIENVQRADLSYFDQAEAIRILMSEFDLSAETVAKQIGEREFTVLNKLELLKFNQEERKMFIDNALSERYAMALVVIDDAKIRRNILEKVIKNKLTVKQTEELVFKLISPNTAAKQKIVIKDIRFFSNTINKAVNTMRNSGINATEEKTETDDFIEYKIRISK